MTTIRRPNRRRIPELAALVNGGVCAGSGKIRWLSERGAEQAAAIMANHDPDPERAARLVTYRHAVCGDWHVGHRAPQRPEAAS